MTHESQKVDSPVPDPQTADDLFALLATPGALDQWLDAHPMRRAVWDLGHAAGHAAGTLDGLGLAEARPDLRDQAHQVLLAAVKSPSHDLLVERRAAALEGAPRRTGPQLVAAARRSWGFRANGAPR